MKKRDLIVNLSQYRQSDSEQRRTKDLLCTIDNLANADHEVLDIGARDGYFSKVLADRFKRVVALDLEKPEIAHEKVTCVSGDVTTLEFEDEQFELVFCCEVLEHIPPNLLKDACSELSRVCKGNLLIGVPYKQDIRLRRTTCQSCGQKNPPWGHVNSFDENRLTDLFSSLSVSAMSFVGVSDGSTNAISAFLMDLAGNPYGTYQQEEVCVYCGSQIEGPLVRTVLQKVFTKVATLVWRVQKRFSKKHRNWIHILFRKEQLMKTAD